MIRRSSVAEPLQSSSSPTLRLVLVGLGFWGGSWIRVIRESRHCALVALVDTDEAALGRAASAADIQSEECFASIADAVEAIRADAALIVVPPAAHARVALEALECGLHCLIEKPFASTLEDARLITERADSVGRVVMVSQQYRYRDGAQTVKRLIDAGAVGRIGVVHISFSNVLPVPGFQLQMEEPLLWDMAIHHFDLIRGILGVEPVRVQATSYNPSWSEFAGNAATTAVFESENGTTITYAGSWAPRGGVTGWDGVWEILGEDGAIHWDGNDVILRPLARPLIAKIQRRALKREWKGQRIKLTPVGEADRLGSLAEFSAAIWGNRQPETSGRDNIRSLALTVAAVESVRRRTAVDVAELLGVGR